jgi:hypothetical protein
MIFGKDSSAGPCQLSLGLNAWRSIFLFSSLSRAQCWRVPLALTGVSLRALPVKPSCEPTGVLAQAKAMARANGMTDVQKRRAMECLARAD